MIRAVLDTNTLISGIFWPGTPRKIYVAAYQERFRILTTTNMLAELNLVLNRAKFAQALIALGKTAVDLLTELRDAAEVVSPAEITAGVVRDPKDEMILACAVGGEADYIVTGDKDLLTLVTFEGIPILTATQFLERLAVE
jgi:putative PIN family toxin of toxin-antitoxin system